jgi:hypothetical protein
MISTNKIFKLTGVIYTLFMLMIPTIANATIELRDTFEGPGTQLEGWTVNTNNDGYVERRTEDESNNYASQAHGDKSVVIYDPNDTSFANAYKTFSNSASEYMVEFYLWIWSQSTATIDSFPLCVLWNIPALGLPEKTDISLFLDESGDTFLVYLEDSTGIQDSSVATINSTDRWYKIQIYRYVSGSDAVVTLYLDGDSIDTYVPMNKDKVSNKISLGTTQADSLADGEVFYDDIIISTPPEGGHPRLLFTASDTSSLRAKAGNDNPTTIGRSFKQIANSIKSYAHTLADNDIIKIVVDADTHYFVHPFAYPADFDTCSSLLLWNTLGGEIRARLVYFAFTHLLFPDSSIGDTSRVKAKEILNSLATWQQWVNPYAVQSNNVRVYFAIETSHLTYGASLAYDIVFDSLNNYDRMSLQNALLALSIGQLYLESLYGVLGSNLGQEPSHNGGNWANYFMFCNGALGMSINSVRPAFDSTPPELDTARSRIIDSLFQKDSICDPAGGYVEGILYSSVLDFVYLFGIADSIGNSNNSIINDSFFIKAPYFRVYAKAPGDNFDLSEGRRELNFGDSYESSPYVNGFLLKYAARNNDPLIQRYFKYAYHGQYYEYFLWMDASFDTTHPAGNMFGRLFPNIGWAVLRDGWRSEDYQIAIKSGRKVGHTHRDNNTIILGTNNRWLITDAGYCSYGDDTPRSWPINHNVLIVADNDSNPCDTTGIISRFYISENIPGEMDSIFGYFRGDASNAYSELNKYIRDVLFVNKNPPFFIICDGVQSVANEDSFTWLFHTWGDVTYNADSQVISIEDTVMGDDPEYLDIKVMWPDSIVYADTIIDDNQCSGDMTRTRIYLKKKYLVSTPSYEQFIAVLIPDHNNQPTITAEKIAGKGLIGAKVGNTTVLFGDHADSVPGGKYEVSVTNSLLNIVCNLVPDTNYLVITKKGTDNETIDTLQTNDVGILSFKLNGTGNWKVIITLARDHGFD